MNDTLKFILILLLVVSAIGVVVEHYIEPLVIEEQYQGPVRPTDNESYFRQTGITKPLVFDVSSSIPYDAMINRLVMNKPYFYEMPSGHFVFDSYIANPKGLIVGYINKQGVAVRL